MSIVLSTMLLAPACKEEPDIQPPVKEYDSRLDIKWIKWFTEDSAGAYFLDPQFYGDYVVFGTTMPVGDNGKEGLGVFNKLTGKKHPNWDEYYPDLTPTSSNDLLDLKTCGQWNQIAVMTNMLSIESWDLSTGTHLWSDVYNPDHGQYPMAVYHGIPYVPYESASRKWGKIDRYDPLTGAKENLVHIPWEQDYSITMHAPALWINRKKDTIMLFATSSINYLNLQGRANVYAYNITADTFLWRNNNIDSTGNAESEPPIVVGDRVIFRCISTMHCYDIPSGKLLWVYDFDNKIKSHNFKPLYADGKIFTRSTEIVWAVDLITGQKVWSTDIRLNNLEGGSMAYYKGKLYFTASDDTDPNYARSLFCLDGATGNLIWKDKGPNKYGGMAFGVIVDPATGYLYATDAFRMMCIDLNNTLKKP